MSSQPGTDQGAVEAKEAAEIVSRQICRVRMSARWRDHYELASLILSALAEAGYTVVKTEDEWEYGEAGGCTAAFHCHAPHIGVTLDGQLLHTPLESASHRRRVYRVGPWVPVPEGDEK